MSTRRIRIKQSDNTYKHVAFTDDMDGKQDKLTASEQAAASSGITAGKVSGYDAHTADASSHVSSMDRLAWNGKQDALTEANAGTNIVITRNESGVVTISSTGGGSGAGGNYIAGAGINISGATLSADFNTVAKVSALADKQDKLTASEQAAADSGITSAKVTSYDSHVSNTSVHVTTSDKTTWSGKQDKLTVSEQAAVDSGITVTKVGSYDTHLSDTDKHITSTERTTWNNKQDKLVAGSGVSIVGNVISSVGGGEGSGAGGYVAGTGINISGSTISADLSTVASVSALNEKQPKLSTAQQTAVDSGVTSTKVGNYDVHVADGTKHVTADDKTTWNGKQDKLVAGANISIVGNVINATTEAAQKTYEKWVIVGVYGQSNAVGYDESMLTKYDVPCEYGRVMQYSDSLKPLTFCAENLQNMNTIGKRSGSSANMAAARTNSMTGDAFTPSYVDRTTKVATKGIHLPLANLICSVIPDDYGVIIVPGAYGGQNHTAFLKNTTYYNQFKTRLQNALALHEDNYLAGIIWCQGEFDTAAGTARATYKANFSQMITDLDNDIKTNNYKKLPDSTEPKNYWYVYEWPKHYKDADANDLLGAQKEVVGESHYVPIPDETPFNETDYTSGTLAAHFAGDSFRKVIAPRVFAKMQAAGAFQNVEYCSGSGSQASGGASSEELQQLTARVATLETETSTLKVKNSNLEAEVAYVKGANTALNTTLEELRVKVNELLEQSGGDPVAPPDVPDEPDPVPTEEVKVLTADMITKGHNNGVLSDFTVEDGVLTIGTGQNIGGGVGALLLDDSITRFEGTFRTVGSNLSNSFVAMIAKDDTKEEGFFLNAVSNNKTYTSTSTFSQNALNGGYVSTPVSAGSKLVMEKNGNTVKVMLDDTVVFEGDMADKVWAAATCTQACLGFGGAWTARSNPAWVLEDCKVTVPVQAA